MIRLLNENFTGNANAAAEQFFKRLPEIFNKLWADGEAIFPGNPAAESIDEVILAYPGL